MRNYKRQVKASVNSSDRNAERRNGVGRGSQRSVTEWNKKKRDGARKRMREGSWEGWRAPDGEAQGNTSFS